MELKINPNYMPADQQNLLTLSDVTEWRIWRRFSEY